VREQNLGCMCSHVVFLRSHFPGRKVGKGRTVAPGGGRVDVVENLGAFMELVADDDRNAEQAQERSNIGDQSPGASWSAPPTLTTPRVPGSELKEGTNRAGHPHPGVGQQGPTRGCARTRTPATPFPRPVTEKVACPTLSKQHLTDPDPTSCRRRTWVPRRGRYHEVCFR